MVLLVRCTTDRDDWQSLSAIGVPLDSRSRPLAGKDKEAELLVLQAINAARKSPDLTLRR